ncbi:hypothetical protein OH687_31190 [Burkholderia anthina]|nr:hypothetical protein OH687_31190 [Burkholderia anthina]
MSGYRPARTARPRAYRVERERPPGVRARGPEPACRRLRIRHGFAIALRCTAAVLRDATHPIAVNACRPPLFLTFTRTLYARAPT